MEKNNFQMAIMGFFAVMVFAIPTILSVSTGYIIWHALNYITFPIGKAITEAADSLNG